MSTPPTVPGVLDAWRDVIHPAALILPRPNPVDYAELKHSVEKHGLLTPLSTFVDKSGEHWLLDGVSRLQVLVELDRPVLDADGRWAVPTLPYREDEGADPYEIALSLNVMRRHLTSEQKRDVIRALREERPDLSDRAIGRMAGVSPHTVADERRAQESNGTSTAEHGDEAAAERFGDTAAASGSTTTGDDDGYAEGDLQEDDGAEPQGDPPDLPPPSEPTPEPERHEETGQRARGRKPGKRNGGEETEEAEVLPDKPFVGTVIPAAAKHMRIAEAKRCVKYLRLHVDDLQPRARA